MSAALSPAAPGAITAPASGADRHRRLLDTLETVELPDGTRVGVRPAGLAPRALAWLLDALICGMITVAVGLICLAAGRYIGFGIGGGLGAIAYFVIYWGYQILFEGSARGATPGKRSMGLRVVRSDGSPAGWNAVILRNIARVVDMQPMFILFPVLPTYLAGLVSCLCTRRFQRLGDLLADTVVVYDDRMRREPPAGLPPLAVTIFPEPPPAALLREERAAIVQFMERASRWSPSRHEEMAAHAEPLLNVTGPPAVLRLLGMGIWLRDASPGQRPDPVPARLPPKPQLPLIVRPDRRPGPPPLPPS